MKATITRLQEKFPEPQFSTIQRRVFASIHCESREFGDVAAAEREHADTLSVEPVAHAPMVRFGAYIDNELVGWTCGWFERGNCYYMANSGVLPEHRQQGIYSALLDAAINHASANGAHTVRSQHSVLNNPVIICKLKRGFHVAGLGVSAQMGTLVELVLHLSGERGELHRSRVIPFVEPDDVRSADRQAIARDVA